MEGEIDLTVDRILTLEETAHVLRYKNPKALRNAITSGTVPVKPKLRRPYRWSSVEVREFLADGRRRSV